MKSEWGYIKKWIARLVKYIFFSISSFHSVFGQKVPSETGQILIRNEGKMTRTWCIKVWNEQNMVRIWSNLIIFWWKSDSEKKSLISFCSDLTEIFTRVEASKGAHYFGNIRISLKSFISVEIFILFCGSCDINEKIK